MEPDQRNGFKMVKSVKKVKKDFLNVLVLKQQQQFFGQWNEL